jgi:hypothetical protein
MAECGRESPSRSPDVCDTCRGSRSDGLSGVRPASHPVESLGRTAGIGPCCLVAVPSSSRTVFSGRHLRTPAAQSSVGRERGSARDNASPTHPRWGRLRGTRRASRSGDTGSPAPGSPPEDFWPNAAARAQRTSSPGPGTQTALGCAGTLKGAGRSCSLCCATPSALTARSRCGEPLRQS